MWETPPDQRSDNEANNEVYLVETARSVAHHAEQVKRPQNGSNHEKAEAPAEVAAGAASVEVAADAESHEKAPAEVSGAVSVEVSADEKEDFFGSVAAEVAASVASAKGAAGAGQERLRPISGGGR